MNQYHKKCCKEIQNIYLINESVTSYYSKGHIDVNTELMDNSLNILKVTPQNPVKLILTFDPTPPFSVFVTFFLLDNNNKLWSIFL